MGFGVPDHLSPAEVKELEEEVVVIWIPVPLTPERLDLVVDALDFA